MARSAPPPRPRGRANPGRIGAARALAAVEEGAHLEDVLPRALPAEGPDRALGWNLAFGVLRRRAELDAALRPHLRQPLDGLDAAVRAVLRVGAYERLHTRTPPHAAVDQAVEVARALGVGRASGLVNAILRRVHPPEGLSRAERLNHPAWLVDRWDARYGAEATERWALANEAPPPLFLVARQDPAQLAADLAEEGVGAGPARIGDVEVPGVLRVEGRPGRVEELPGWDAGHFWVQDAASAWLTDLVPADARTVLDACAAPGGKTFRLAARGHQVTAVDVADGRLDALRGSLGRLRLRADVRVHDWTTGPLEGLGEVDAVLVDAPCTGLGTVRRRPEIRWRRGPFDPAGAATRQAAVLEGAARHVRPGGALVYVVCSPEPEEGQGVVDAFLARHPGFALEEVRTTAPPTHGEDAFWGARLRRR